MVILIPVLAFLLLWLLRVYTKLYSYDGYVMYACSYFGIPFLPTAELHFRLMYVKVHRPLDNVE